ncbi:MAG: ABC transporter substrate-binding protein [Betaproteobacteria bacterium]|nr:MAG: ABC transporter substrate-binding protein [Betaproteobacteria bacterium]
MKMKMKMKVRAVLLVLAGTLVSAPVSAQTVWKFSNWLPPTHPVTEHVIKVWAKQVEEATQGRVKVDVIAPLGAPPAHLDLVKNGVADAACITANYTASRFTLLRGLELPFMSNQNSAMSIAAQRTYDKFFKKANEFDGIKLGGLSMVGPYQIYTTKKAINTIDDFKGQKIREAGGLTKDVVEALGATPFFAPAPQTYEVLSKGVGDGVLFPPESIPGFKVTSAVRHGIHVPGGFNQAAFALIINEGKWKALSPADQTAVEKLLGEHWARLWGELWDKTNAAGIEQMKKDGVEIVDASPALLAEVHKRFGGFESGWLADAQKKGVDGKAALAFYRAEIKALESK